MKLLTVGRLSSRLLHNSGISQLPAVVKAEVEKRLLKPTNSLTPKQCSHVTLEYFINDVLTQELLSQALCSPPLHTLGIPPRNDNHGSTLPVRAHPLPRAGVGSAPHSRIVESGREPQEDLALGDS